MCPICNCYSEGNLVLTMSLGLDWPHAEETRRTCSRESHRVEPTGEAQKRETPAHLETHEDGRARGETPYMAGG